jgi:hypothetical protein
MMLYYTFIPCFAIHRQETNKKRQYKTISRLKVIKKEIIYCWQDKQTKKILLNGIYWIGDFFVYSLYQLLFAASLDFVNWGWSATGRTRTSTFCCCVWPSF